MKVHLASQLRARHVHDHAWMQQEQQRYTSSRSGLSTNQDEENKSIALKYQRRINSEMLRVKNLARLNHNEY